MNFDEYKSRVVRHLERLHAMTNRDAVALVAHNGDLIHAAYMRAHRCDSVAQALMLLTPKLDQAGLVGP